MATCRHLVIGAGLAGGRAVEVLARRAAADEVMLVGAEPVVPYQRPALSKEVLLGRADDAALWLRPPEFYAERGVAMRLGERAVSLDAGARTVRLGSGEEVAFEQALICTGSAARRLRVEGEPLAGVHLLRELADARALASALAGARRCAVVGGGFIGCEVAAACRALGVEVVMLELAAAPCAAVLGETVGGLLADVHRAEGVQVRCGESVAAFLGDDRLEAVETERGERLACDVAVVGVGAVPEVGWLEGSGLELDDGVVVDERLETSVEGIYAAGDIARWPHAGLGRRLRVEHETNAQTQAMAAARSMLGKPTPYRATPFVWSHQYDLDLWAVGDLELWDDVSVDADPHARSLLATYTRAGSVTAVAGINRPDELEPARRRVEAAAAAAH